MEKNKIWFKWELSWLLVPILGYLYFFQKQTRPVLLNLIIIIAVLGIWNTIILKDKILKSKFGNITFWLSIVFHGVLLLSLLDLKQYGFLNKYSIFLFVIGLLILYFLPWWPYALSRKDMIGLAIIIYIILLILHYLLNIKLKTYKK